MQVLSGKQGETKVNVIAYSVIAFILGSITGMGLLNISDPVARFRFLCFSLFVVFFVVVSGHLIGKARVEKEVM